MKYHLIKVKYYFIKVKKTFDQNELLYDQNEIEIAPNEIGIYLNETEFYALLMILIANLIYDYVKDNSEILFLTNEVRFQIGSIVIIHI